MGKICWRNIAERIYPAFPLIALGILFIFNPKFATRYAFEFIVSAQMLFTIWFIFEVIKSI